MTQHKTGGPNWNPWKVTAIGGAVVVATALITGVVVANYTGRSVNSEAQPATDQAAPQNPPPAPPQAPAQSQPAPQPPPGYPRHEHVARDAPPRPSAVDIEACNRYAASVSHDKTTDTVTKGLLGAAIGAGVGAAGGAIAGGGGGAGKGAGIGALVGGTAGTLFGLNQANNSPDSVAAYRACMRRRGYVD